MTVLAVIGGLTVSLLCGIGVATIVAVVISWIDAE